MTSLKFHFVLVIAISCLSVEPRGESFLDLVRVVVSNELSPSKVLLVHCKSKNDDLGIHNLSKNQNFTWKFHPNTIIGNTLFWCYTAPDDKSHASFDAYKESFTLTDCCDKNPDGMKCVWIAKDDGIHLRDFSNNSYDKFKYPWVLGRLSIN
ncbi:Plant self-incompatibility protein S1 family [Euphorbia peplus]|nr:Plant self-incompatibility protein S1 family [Euphorbia peplus]